MNKFLLIICTILILGCNQEPNKITIKDWSYKITYDISTADSIKPLGIIDFKLQKPINDKLRKDIYEKPLLPSISYTIYDASNVEFCNEMILNTKLYSSCSEPYVGGTMVINKKFIFLNTSLCLLNCFGSDTIDYCRPTIDKFLSQLDLTHITDVKELNEIIKQKIED